MAKVLAFKRTTSEVVTVDTVNNTVAVLGAAIPNVDTGTDFPHRSQNLLTVYRGDPYFLYRFVTGEIRLARYDGVAWADVAGFTALTVAAGVLKPLCLQVVNDRLVAIATNSDSGTGDDKVLARRSAQNDGTVWDPAIEQVFATQPTTTNGGSSVIWRDAVFFATYEGIGWYIPSTDMLSASFDQGDDAANSGDGVTVGDFAFWNNDLYFVRAGGAPTLYHLDSAWSPTAPSAAPAWEKEPIQGTPGVSSVNIGPDSITWCMFVNKSDELCIFYSGVIGSKAVKATTGTFPEFTDITVSTFPESIRTTPNIGFTISVDDRRRVNELQSFLLWEPAEATSKLARWSGSGQIDLRTTFSATQFMPPNDRWGFGRTFTNLQPTCHIRSVNQVFPGRMQLDYTVRDIGSKPVDIFGEYSTDGDQWFPMTQGDGDDGAEALATSPSGTNYFFYWDAFIDLDGDFNFMNMRIVARIAGV